MSEKRIANVQSDDTVDPSPTDSPISSYSAKREFNQWWEHWMSKVPHNRMSAKATLTKNVPDEFSPLSELDETITEKEAA